MSELVIIRLSRTWKDGDKTLEGWMNLRLEGYSDKDVKKTLEIWIGRGWKVEVKLNDQAPKP